MGKVKTKFNIKHEQSKCYGYDYKKSVYLKHVNKELIVLCLGRPWDSKYFKGVIVFCGGEMSFRAADTECNKIEESKFVESDKSYCKAGDVFDTFPTDEFTLFEGVITIEQKFENLIKI